MVARAEAACERLGIFGPAVVEKPSLLRSAPPRRRPAALPLGAGPRAQPLSSPRRPGGESSLPARCLSFPGPARSANMSKNAPGRAQRAPQLPRRLRLRLPGGVSANGFKQLVIAITSAGREMCQNPQNAGQTYIRRVEHAGSLPALRV